MNGNKMNITVNNRNSVSYNYKHHRELIMLRMLSILDHWWYVVWCHQWKNQRDKTKKRWVWRGSKLTQPQNGQEDLVFLSGSCGKTVQIKKTEGPSIPEEPFPPGNIELQGCHVVNCYLVCPHYYCAITIIKICEMELQGRTATWFCKYINKQILQKGIHTLNLRIGDTSRVYRQQ